MRLIVGLGNPGADYARNRHNIGFMAVDAIARRHGISVWKARNQGLAAEGEIAGERVMLLKPQTYMNKSGACVGPTARFFKIPPEHVIVFHDELDLAPGKLRVKKGGGAAGHNGLRSLAELFSNDTRRVRLGIGHPGDKDRVQGHVLSDFAKVEQAWLEPLLDAVAEAAPLLVTGDDAGFATRVALLTQPPKPKKPKPGAPARNSEGDA
ncbi:peptidyl-tRNA hydrolase [uncultured Alphaproteobacteria bacterium]|uniref:Peptidyl-tRNA hydrolase n=1 Tax=uncultured Alphaproteobacteria bacterium TaxID=91750 RepID=A0A212JWW3_9PROT|nr:peptidyl-tRNA hydrolase [uncultured Alphaproteobacteria bacterium]